VPDFDFDLDRDPDDRSNAAMLHFMRDGRVYVTIQGRGLIALPADIRRRLDLDSPGAQVEIVERDDGVIELHPTVAVPADQAWFWSKRWQAMEREVDAHVAAGEIKQHDTVEGLVADLDES
jgi:AbrB family looped-hinge helix DNA binding protein